MFTSLKHIMGAENLFLNGIILDISIGQLCFYHATDHPSCRILGHVPGLDLDDEILKD